MRMPQSLYEAVLSGFSAGRDIGDRRALFLFVVDHSSAMLEPLPRTGKSRLHSVVDSLSQMKREMANADRGNHLDIGFLGYRADEETPGLIGSMWRPDPEDGGVVRPVSDRAGISLMSPDADSTGGAAAALVKAQGLVSDWVAANENPLFSPVVLHIVTADGRYEPETEGAAAQLTGAGRSLLFHCCFDELHSSDAIVFPRARELRSELAARYYAISSDMPPLVTEIGELLQGSVSPGLRSRAAGMAEDLGIPSSVASLGLGLLAGGGRVGPYTLEPRVEGLRIESNRGFALVRDMVGFRIFTQLCN